MNSVGFDSDIWGVTTFSNLLKPHLGIVKYRS